MTSLAFILGVVPLVIAHGAGAEMRRALGMAVFSGMLGVTLFGIFLTPVFFYVIQPGSANPRRGGRKPPRRELQRYHGPHPARLDGERDWQLDADDQQSGSTPLGLPEW